MRPLVSESPNRQRPPKLLNRTVSHGAEWLANQPASLATCFGQRQRPPYKSAVSDAMGGGTIGGRDHEATSYPTVPTGWRGAKRNRAKRWYVRQVIEDTLRRSEETGRRFTTKSRHDRTVPKKG